MPTKSRSHSGLDNQDKEKVKTTDEDLDSLAEEDLDALAKDAEEKLKGF
jgi:hypothetical protein